MCLLGPYLEDVTNFVYSPVTDIVFIFIVRVETISNIDKSGADVEGVRLCYYNSYFSISIII